MGNWTVGDILGNVALWGLGAAIVVGAAVKGCERSHPEPEKPQIRENFVPNYDRTELCRAHGGQRNYWGKL